MPLVVAACRQGSGNDNTTTLPIPAALFGANGCNGPNQSFGSLAPVGTGSLVIGPLSQMAAARDTLGASGNYELYVTGDMASLVKLVFDPADPATPVSETVLIAPGEVDALPEYVASVPGPAVLSGVAILDSAFVVVVENTGNTLLLVSRTAAGSVSVYPGLAPDPNPGNADGPGGLIRFNFMRETQIAPSGDGRILIGDPGNHSVRELAAVGLPSAATLAGTGAAFYQDGDLATTGFDTPSGTAISCSGELFVTESGMAGAGGNRLRALSVGEFNVFTGAFAGGSVTLAGDGTAATVGGVGELASLAGPVSPVVTMEGEVYWIDSDTGVLRRYAEATGQADCPFFATCAAATATLGVQPNFTTSTGGAFALAIAENDVLYALDAAAAELWHAVP